MAGESWVVVERRGDGARRVSLEALGKLAALGLEPVAVVIGSGVGPVATAVAPYARLVLVVEHAAFADALSEVLARALGDLAAQRTPRSVVAGATAFGRDLCARLSARLRSGYVADAVELSRAGDGDLLAVRPVLGGKAYAEVAFRGTGPRVVSVRPNAFPAPQPGAPGPIERIPAGDIAPGRARIVERREQAAGRVDLAEADVIVAGGRGVRGPEGFAVLERLAEALGGAVGASRAAVDAGWRDHASQVGKSGRTVSPKLYVAFGISGAVHHRMGMDTARTIVVVNSDPNAAFFKHADYGLVGDFSQIAPALAEALRQSRET